MKINTWSVVNTADKYGLALKPEHCETEICVRAVGDVIIIRAYIPGNEKCIELCVDAGARDD